MRNRFLALVGLFSLALTFLAVPSAFAVGSGALPVRRLMSASPVLTWQHATLVASTVKGMTGVTVNNTGDQALLLAFGGSGAEVNQVIVGGHQDTGFMPLAGGYATRLSVVALDGPSENGELDVNVFYN